MGVDDRYGKRIAWLESVLFRVHPTHVCDEFGEYEGDNANCEKNHDGAGKSVEIVHASVTEGGPEQFYDPRHESTKYTIFNPDQEDGHPWIAVHPKCFDIAQRVTAIKMSLLGDRAGCHAATSLGRLYAILRKRCMIQSRAEHIFPREPPYMVLWEPHEYFGLPAAIWWDIEWNYQPDYPHLKEFEASPFPLAGVTKEILSYLVPFTQQEVTTPSTRGAVLSLPQEILDEIINQFMPLQEIPITPTRILPPAVWKMMLFSGKMFPWLWDLTSDSLASMIDADRRTYEDDNAWDWEQLVRQLAQVDIFTKGHTMENVQLGLRNRRRIWRLVDVAKMGDWNFIKDIRSPP